MHKIPINLFRFQSVGILFMLLALTGCTDDLLLNPIDNCDDPGREVMMPLSLDVEDMVTLSNATRSEDDPVVVTPPDPTILEDEKRLHDFWVLQYNAAGYRVGMPYYQVYSGEDEKPVIPILVPTVEGSRFSTVVVANTGDPALFTDENSATIRKVKNVHKPMRNADDVWNIIGDKKHLLMSGKTDIDINTVSLSTKLRPNVAKLHLYFKLMKTTDGEGDAGGGNSWDRKRKTHAVNWGNVPDIPYADILYESDNYNDDEHRFPSPVNPANLNVFPITTDKNALNTIIGYSLDMSDKPSTIDVYLPRNTQGVNQNTDPYLKSTYATDHALFLELVTSDKEETQQNKYRRIEFLPGGNDVNDYNIIPGKYYDIDFTFSNFPTDNGPVKKMYRRYGEANAYIVDPYDTHIVNRFPISPVNNYATGAYPTRTSSKYWEETYFNIYEQELKMVNNDVTGKLTQDPATWQNRDVYFTATGITGSIQGMSFAILPSTEWIAEVIWQDRPERLINFCDYLGLLTHNGDYYESAGAMWLPVKTSQFNNYKITFFSKPIGQGKYVFDPTSFKDPLNDKNPTRSDIFFKTTGAEGNVIVGIRKKTDKEKAGGEAPPLTEREYLWSWHLWITGYNPAAAGHSTMDRNIGAIEPGDAGFYYQFNRKDPFPNWNAKVYDINGKELTQLRHKVGPEGNETSVSMLCRWNDAKPLTTTKEKAKVVLQGVNSPFTLLYLTNITASGTNASKVRTVAQKDYKNEVTASWNVATTFWTPEDPSPQGWVLPPDEKQKETPAGSWTIASSWEGLNIPVSGLLSDPYVSSDFNYIFRPGGAFLWLNAFGTISQYNKDENGNEIGILINTTEYKVPFYPIGNKLKVDALPVRCSKK